MGGRPGPSLPAGGRTGGAAVTMVAVAVAVVAAGRAGRAAQEKAAA